jgi:hypothetical protein
LSKLLDTNSTAKEGKNKKKLKALLPKRKKKAAKARAILCHRKFLMHHNTTTKIWFTGLIPWLEWLMYVVASTFLVLSLYVSNFSHIYRLSVI